MSFQQILNTETEFQSRELSKSFINTSSMPIKLSVVSGTLALIDDFNDGVRDPLWATGLTNVEVFSYEPITNNQVGRLNVPNTGQDFLAQTFTPASSINLGAVSMLIDPVNIFPTEGITIELRTTDGSGLPTSTVLGSKFLAVGSWGFPAVGDFVRVQWIFNSLITLQAGVKYAIVISASWAPSGTTYAEVLGSTVDNYSGGQAFRYDASQSAWLSAIFNVQDYYFKLYEGTADVEPVETGGFLQFDYPNDSGQKSTPVARNEALPDINLETRFIWDILSASANASFEFGMHFLKGPIAIHTTDKEDYLVWELLFSVQPSNGAFRILPVIKNSAGVKQTFDGTDWVNLGSQFGFLVGAPGDNVPVTFRVTRDSGTNGLVMLAYRNDNHQDIIFETTASPQLFNPSGDYHLNLALGVNIHGSRFKFDYFKVPSTPEESASGELILRHSYGVRSQLKQLQMDRLIQSLGSAVNLSYRTAETLGELDSLPFSSVLPTTVLGNIETADILAPYGLFADTKLEFVRGAGPGPELNAFALTLEPEVIVPPPPPESAVLGEDKPIIFSLNEARSGASTITDSESGVSETENTLKLKDSDTETQWVSQSSLDSQDVTITVQFINQQGSAENRLLNAVYLRNTNVKSYRIHTGTENLTAGDLSQSDALIVFDELETNSIQLTVSSTQTPNENKKIGELYVGRILLILPGFNSYEPGRMKLSSGQMRTIGGRLIRFEGSSKYFSRWTVTFLSGQDKDTLEAIYKENEFISFLPEPDFRPRDLYDVGWQSEELTFPYSEVFKTPGHTVEILTEEIGG